MDSLTKEEQEFINKARKLGFNIVKHNNVDKVEINLQRPINLEENFELPHQFNNLVYYTCEV